MAINPDLLVIKPVNQLESVTGLQAGELLFYDGGSNLKKIDIDTFNNLSKTAKPLKPTDPTPTEEGLYMPTEAGTYANADGLIAQEGYYTLFFFDGTNWTKSETKLPENSVKIPNFEDLNFPVSNQEQTVYNQSIYQLLDGQTASSTDVPGVSDKWQMIGGFDNEKYGTSEFITPQFFTNATYDNNGSVVNFGYDYGATGGVWFNAGDRITVGYGTNAVMYYLFLWNPDFTLKEKLLLEPNGTGGYKNHTFIADYSGYLTMNSNFSDTLGLPKFKIEKLEEIYQKKIDNSTDIIGDAILNKFSRNGQIYDLGGGGCVQNIDAQGVEKITLTIRTLEAIYNIPVLYGKKISDGSYVNIWNKASQTLYDFDIEIPKNTYSLLYVNFSMRAEPNKIILHKSLTSNSGGSGISVDRTMIFAENYGVSASNTATENRIALQTLCDTYGDIGTPIYLPIGNIYIDATINVKSRTNLIGASWGGVLSGGTRLIATSPMSTMLNVVGVQTLTDIQDGIIKEIKLDGNNLAEKGILLNELVAYMKIERVSFSKITQIGFKSVGALIYQMHGCRFINIPIGVKTERTTEIQANLIRFQDTQFMNCGTLAADISGGAQVIFDGCDISGSGTVGNVNTGSVKISDMSPSGEGMDVTFRNCWSEYANGGFWLKVEGGQGVVNLDNGFLWRLTGDCQTGIINDGGDVLLSGGFRINDFNTDIITKNNGVTSLMGRVKIGSHVEQTGGIYKTSVFS